MRQDSSQKSADTVSVRALVLAIFLSIAGTVGVLEWQNKIHHPESKDQFDLASYKVVFVPTEDEGQYRLSPKPSYQTSFCQEGYLFIRNDKDHAMQGLLVDYKNRGIKCEPRD
ncbi:hypothetical protein A3744_26380, partial [Oleiphilus sp. HI0073]